MARIRDLVLRLIIYKFSSLSQRRQQQKPNDILSLLHVAAAAADWQ